jgi:uncharacterized membrane protein
MSGLRMTLMARMRAYFFAGVLIVAPISVTFYIAWLVISFVDGRVDRLIPPAYNPDNYLPFSIPGLGFLILIVSLILIGWTTAGLIGRLFTRLSESVVERMPVIRSIYGATKQVFETLFAQQRTSFKEVVLLQFPREGMWRIGFATGTIPGATQTMVEGGLLNVFVPNTPNATAGFLVLVRPADLIKSDLTVEAALKLVISGGIAVPEGKAPVTPSARA